MIKKMMLNDPDKFVALWFNLVFNKQESEGQNVSERKAESLKCVFVEEDSVEELLAAPVLLFKPDKAVRQFVLKYSQR